MSRYNEHDETFHRLDEAYKNAFALNVADLEQERIVILCDVHKGDKTDSDDFKNNEDIYCHALRYYFKEKFRLVLNGDNEETWESPFAKIAGLYKDTAFREEKAFAAEENHYFRIFGNHDIYWENLQELTDFLLPLLGSDKVYQALVINDQIFIVHGHQGERYSDKKSKTSRWMVKHIWAPLERIHRTGIIRPIARLLGIDCEKRAAEDPVQQQTRDKLLYEWAEKNRKMLIAGHTHCARFCSMSKEELQRDMLNLVQQQADRSKSADDFYLRKVSAAYLTEQKNLALADPRRAYLVDEKDKVPCYFNAGSCVFTNGITAIELDRGTLNLVKWEITDTVYDEKLGLTRRLPYFISIERKLYQTTSLMKTLQRIQTSSLSV